MARAPRRRRLSGIVRDLRTLRTRTKAIEQAEVLIQAVRVLREDPPRLDDLSDLELLAYSRRLLDLAARGLTAELGVAASGAAAYRRLELILGSHLGADAAIGAVQRVTSGGGMSPRRDAQASAAVFGGPTWTESGVEPSEPPTVDPNLHMQRLADLEATLKALPGWTRRRVLTGQVVDVRVHLVRRTGSPRIDR